MSISERRVQTFNSCPQNQVLPALVSDRVIAFEPFWGTESVINVCVNERDLLYWGEKRGAEARRRRRYTYLEGEEREIEGALCA